MTYRDLPPQPYSVAEASHVLGIGRDAVRDRIKDGSLKGAFRSGKKLWRIPVQAVADYIERQSIAAP